MEEFFGNLSKSLEGAAELLKNIAEAKQNAIKSISPVIAEIGKVHNVTEDLFANLSQTLQGTAELLINIAETKQNAIKNIGPVLAQVVKVVGSLASSAPPLIKGKKKLVLPKSQSNTFASRCFEEKNYVVKKGIQKFQNL